MSTVEFAVRENGQLRDSASIFQSWKRRREAARKHRRQFEKTWLESQYFAAGKQWIEYSSTTRQWRALRSVKGQERQTHDVLLQNLWTVIGALAADDFRPQFIFEHEDTEGESIADYVNKAIGYGWEQEWDGDTRIHELLLILAVYGTGALRCRYDRSQGSLVSEQMPYANGQPLLDPSERTAHMEQAFTSGQQVQMGPLREGKVKWEVLAPWNLLPPPGVSNPQDFPWEIVVRPVPLEEIKAQYGAAGSTVQAQSLDSTEIRATAGVMDVQQQGGSLEEQALVYTGYQRPSTQYPQGHTFVFTDSTPLDYKPGLPYPTCTSQSGVVYFGYWPVPGQFWHRGFIEPGIGPQKTLNKRETQADQIIDRSMPWVPLPKSVYNRVKPPTGRVMEFVEWPENSPMPNTITGITSGAVQGISADIERLKENVSDALGVKGIALGENPTGVQTYSQLALLKEAESTKLGPVSQRFKLGLSEVTKLSLAAMRNWPAGKKLAIVSDEDKLQVIQWDKSRIPDDFVIRPSKQGAQPRGVGAQLALIDDLFNAANLLGISAQKPQEWFDWYERSKQAGAVEESPDSGVDEQHHKAELENMAMLRGSGPLPVAPYDQLAVHGPAHQDAIEQLSELLTADPSPEVQQAIQALTEHLQMHEQMAVQTQAPQAPPPQAPMQAAGAPVSPPGVPAA